MVEGQERNMVQLARIGVAVEWRWVQRRIYGAAIRRTKKKMKIIRRSLKMVLGKVKRKLR